MWNLPGTQTCRGWFVREPTPTYHSIAAANKLDSLDSRDHREEFTEVHIRDILPPEEDVDDGLDHETFMDKLANQEAVNDSDASYLNCKIEGAEELQTAIKTLARKYRYVFRETLVPAPALLEPMVLKVNEEKWRLNKNREPRRPFDKVKRMGSRPWKGHILFRWTGT